MAKKKTRLEAALSAGSALSKAAKAGRRAGSAVTGMVGNISNKDMDLLKSRYPKNSLTKKKGIVGNTSNNDMDLVENSLIKKKGMVGNISNNDVELLKNSLTKKKKKTEAERIREQSDAAVSAEELRRLQTKPLE
tara:strand:- start:204 stop:608 length:405 start_codon:yes stop_codon:yes gene_type:complete